MTARRRVALAALLLLPLGCIRGTLPARELYRLVVPDSVVAAGQVTARPPAGGTESLLRPALDGTLAVLATETPGLYGENGIVFRVGDGEYGAYPAREWALPLGDMLGHLTARVAAAGGLVREAPVYAPPSPRTHAYVWHSAVREFEEVNRGTTLLVAVRIDATIVRARDDSVVWAGTAAREQPVTAGTDMPSVVRALSLAAAEVVGELVARAARELAAPVADAAVPAARAP